MAMKINAMECTACAACEAECPNDAISEKSMTFKIDAIACTECEGQFDAPQCVEVCPADCIVKA